LGKTNEEGGSKVIRGNTRAKTLTFGLELKQHWHVTTVLAEPLQHGQLHLTPAFCIGQTEQAAFVAATATLSAGAEIKKAATLFTSMQTDANIRQIAFAIR
jgi:hypothetical protein